ncbi:MAG: hypothetical protein A2Y62_15160 [Candidatus Fischerbacteria bacterium RBG_13_37_8]|uniref:DUF5723 domain-containing protein n=1 Tax=Candidatus Fischerbacteria bacterium RBG_13_37_8 TaxID=1817863 RepID=A0A1F5VPI3_9BACT|nr:MAG: hypothetical protein A2Y62_15160 [Candidatus Fischerbacteria bacterium RBG_13_37_8]
MIADLEELKRRYPNLGEEAQKQVAHDLGYDYSEKEPRFYIDFNEFRLDVESWTEPTKSYRFRWSEGNRITNTKFIRQSYSVNWGMAYDSKSLVWDVGTTIGFTRDDLGELSQENYDSVMVSSGLAFPTLGKDLGLGFSISPEVRMAWQTELTPQEGISPYTNEPWGRLNLLRGTVALSISGLGLDNLAYVGLFTEQNFLFEKHSEGLQVQFMHVKYLGKVSWQNVVQSMYYFPNKKDTQYDLGFYAKWRSSLTIPFVKRLSFYTYMDVLAYRGKVEMTKETGRSVVFGAGVSWTRPRWKPGRESLFH